MRTLFSLLVIVAFMTACNNETKTETETNKSDSSAVQTVDSLKEVMDRVEDSAKRARDSASLRK
ncbi:MAG TPA: hypothetical protein VGD33_01875 [Chitinophagaceae bacterium]